MSASEYNIQQLKYADFIISILTHFQHNNTSY